MTTMKREQSIFFIYIIALFFLGYFAPEEALRELACFVLFIIATIFNTEMDTIKYKPNKSWYPQNIFWIKDDATGRSWLLKYPLSMLWDGWHWTKFIFIFSLMEIPGIILHIWWLPITLYAIIWGGIWNLFYDN